jgi:LacI family transcriptional regulator
VQLQNAVDRLQGYKNVLRECNLTEDPALVRTGDFRFGSGYLQTKELLLGPRRPTALFVSNGVMGLGALKALKEMSLNCPQDLALAVFDELPGIGSFSPEVTAVVQPSYDIGNQGAKLLIQQIQTGVPESPVEIRLTSELRIRESTVRRVNGL